MAGKQKILFKCNIESYDVILDHYQHVKVGILMYCIPRFKF